MKPQNLETVIGLLTDIRSQLNSSADTSVVKDIDEAIFQLQELLEDSDSESSVAELSSLGLEILGKVLERLPQIEALIRILLD